MEQKIKVTYFNLKAAAEGIRLILSHAKVDFEDIRVTKEEWFKKWMKSTNSGSCPSNLGRLPFVEMDGKTYDQSIPICRYLAHKYGLAGTTDLEDLEIDIAVGIINDLGEKAAVAHHELDAGSKQLKVQILRRDIYPIYFSRLEHCVAENEGYLACGRLTWADFMLTSLWDYLNKMVGFNIGEKYPSLLEVCHTVKALPEIKRWYDRAPPTEY